MDKQLKRIPARKSSTEDNTVQIMQAQMHSKHMAGLVFSFAPQTPHQTNYQEKAMMQAVRSDQKLEKIRNENHQEDYLKLVFTSTLNLPLS